MHTTTATTIRDNHATMPSTNDLASLLLRLALGIMFLAHDLTNQPLR